eukprot:1195260-Prorocentrum_minimum.AAC.1
MAAAAPPDRHSHYYLPSLHATLCSIRTGIRTNTSTTLFTASRVYAAAALPPARSLSAQRRGRTLFSNIYTFQATIAVTRRSPPFGARCPPRPRVVTQPSTIVASRDVPSYDCFPPQAYPLVPAPIGSRPRYDTLSSLLRLVPAP